MTQPETLPAREGGRGFAFVVLAYRCAMAEISGTQEPYRAGVWEALDQVAPGGEADALIGCVFRFVRSLVGSAERPLEWRSTLCAHLCRDEWLAVAMIDAAQRADVAGLLGYACELVGVEDLGDALNATQALAFALSRRGFYLRPAPDGEPGSKRTLH